MTRGDQLLHGLTAAAVAVLGFTVVLVLGKLASLSGGTADVWAALVRSLAIAVVATGVAVPVGIGAAIYGSEYRGELRGRPALFADLADALSANLAAVPPVVFGLVGLAVFAEGANTWLAGALTLGALAIPIVMIAARRALEAVPPEVREASLSLGLGRFETVRGVVLPIALPGILTGVILAAARVVGETAPLLVLGVWAAPTRVYELLGDDPQSSAQMALGLLILVLLLVGAALAVRWKGDARSDP